jgi:flagellar hook-associated protein 1
MSILGSLFSTANALSAYDRMLEVTQNNVTNASTPGYVKQRLTLQARPFEPSTGAVGGVKAGTIQSYRDDYAEQSVRRQTLLLGSADGSIDRLTALQSAFDISGRGGIPNSLNNLLQSFSAWAQQPTDPIARENVMQRAGALAQSFQQTAGDLANIAQDTELQIRQTVDNVNRLASKLQAFNASLMKGNTQDSALDAQVHATLEELSSYVDVTVLRQDDGSFNVLLGGQTALVVGDQQYPISYRLEQPTDPPPTYPGARPLVRISGADGADITGKITEGKLGSLVNFRNNTLTSYIGDAYQPGDLNVMAKQLADRVNQLLTSGNISEGPPAVPGVALFTYDSSNPTSVAQTLRVNPAINRNQLAAISGGSPSVSNGVALSLANLTSSQNAADRIDGATYTQFYGNLAARVGRNLSDAEIQRDIQQSSVAQAKDIREQISGVSLDEEAAYLIQFQRAYEANSRLVSVLNDLTETIINLVRP